MSKTANKDTLPIAAMVVFYVLASAAFAVLPLLVGATVELLGFTAKQAGLIGGADMFGATISALCVSFIIPRGKWRLLIIWGVLILTVGMRFGVGATVPCPAPRSFRGRTGRRNGVDDRNGQHRGNPQSRSSLWLCGCRPGGLRIARALSHAGPTGRLRFAWGVLVPGCPDRRHNTSGAVHARLRALSESPTTPTVKVSLSRTSFIGLAGVFTYFIAMGGVWAYLDRIAMAHHISTSNVGVALALSAIGGFLGALLASWLDVRYGRLKPLLWSTVGTAVALLTLSGSATLAVFTAMAGLFNFSWNVAGPYQFGALAEIDSSRRTVALAGVLVYAGLAVGPALAAAIISEQSVQNVIWMGIVLSGISLLLFGRILIPRERGTAVQSRAA